MKLSFSIAIILSVLSLQTACAAEMVYFQAIRNQDYRLLQSAFRNLTEEERDIAKLELTNECFHRKTAMLTACLDRQGKFKIVGKSQFYEETLGWMFKNEGRENL